MSDQPQPLTDEEIASIRNNIKYVTGPWPLSALKLFDRLLAERAEMVEKIKQQKEWIDTLNADREALLSLLKKECGLEYLPKAVAEIMARKAAEAGKNSGHKLGKSTLPPPVQCNHGMENIAERDSDG
ncbi:MAG: hypothetical protein GY832_25080 [Chloroflexi bacterium]|nr:hypothetical protein [Chloroflexota bacterium]